MLKNPNFRQIQREIPRLEFIYVKLSVTGFIYLQLSITSNTVPPLSSPDTPSPAAEEEPRPPLEESDAHKMAAAA